LPDAGVRELALVSNPAKLYRFPDAELLGTA